VREAARRIGASAGVIGGLTALVSAIAGLLLGTPVGRAVANGLYVVGCFLIVLGVFAGLRGPLRPGAEGEERGSSFAGLLGLGILGGRIRNATGEERADAIGTAWLFLGLGVLLIVAGVVVDDRAGLT
jgi:hypothetical protein